MKIRAFIFVLLLSGIAGLRAQTFELTHMAFSATSNLRPFSGKIEILDSFVVFTTYSETDSTSDSSVTKERILKKKNGYVKTLTSNGANNYEYGISSDKKEKKERIYYISVLFVHNNGDRLTLIYKGKLMD